MQNLSKKRISASDQALFDMFDEGEKLRIANFYKRREKNRKKIKRFEEMEEEMRKKNIKWI